MRWHACLLGGALIVGPEAGPPTPSTHKLYFHSLGSPLAGSCHCPWDGPAWAGRQSGSKPGEGLKLSVGGWELPQASRGAGESRERVGRTGRASSERWGVRCGCLPERGWVGVQGGDGWSCFLLPREFRVSIRSLGRV